MHATEDRGKSRRRWVPALVLVAFGLAAVVGVAIWFALSARTAYAELEASHQDLLTARSALLDDTDLTGAGAALSAASEHASAAADEVDSRVWDAAARFPVLGATPATVQAVAIALDQALAGLAPAFETLGTLDPQSLISPEGRVDLAALQSAAPALQDARDGIAEAQATLAAAPSRAAGQHVVGAVDEAAQELAAQLSELEGTLGAAITTARIAPRLLGADGPQRYFVAILNPNEARGTGGFLGTYVIIRADAGRITVEQVGSNSDMPTLPALPASLNGQYRKRYGEDPRLIANMNISPHHPDAATLWLESWRLKTGQTLDGAFSADVVALGDLITATGETVPLPDGGSLTGAELTGFAIEGIYEKFPDVGDVPARKAYQEAVTAAAFEVVTGSENRTALALAIGQALGERRIQLWSADTRAEAEILDSGLGGSLRVPKGHNAAFAAINVSGSKLDAFLERRLAYEVGRCANPAKGTVASAVEVGLIHSIEPGQEIPEYMISLAKRGPVGPINTTIAQIYLPRGATVDDVFIDGESTQYSSFTEQGRPMVAVQLDLPPRQERTVRVTFSEPTDDGPGTVVPQPLGSDQATSVLDRPCVAGSPDPDPSSSADE